MTKNKIKVYLSIPITGKESTLWDRHRNAVEALTKKFVHDIQIVSPIDLNKITAENVSSDEHDNAYYMGKDIEALLRCDAIYMCSGWRYSKGCMAEYEIAKIYDLPVYYENEYLQDQVKR